MASSVNNHEIKSHIMADGLNGASACPEHQERLCVPPIRATAVTKQRCPDFKDQVHERGSIATPLDSTTDKHRIHGNREFPDFKDQFRAASNTCTRPFGMKCGPAFKDQFREGFRTTSQPDHPQNTQGSSALPNAIALDPSMIRREEVELEIARRQQELSSKGKVRRCIIIAAIAGFIFTIAVALGSVCGSGKCSRSTLSTSTGLVPDGSQPGPLVNEAADAEDVLSEQSQLIFDFINNITYSDQTFSYPLPANGTEEEQALGWLIQDEVTLSIDEGWRVAQRYTLATLWFQQPDPEQSTLFRWLNGHECTWSGVACFESGQVFDLRIVNAMSGGTIPNDIAHLQNVQHLDLRRNKLTGTIPSTLSFLKEVRAVFFGDNMLSGTIPSELSEMTSLLTLHVSENKLTGTIPDSLSQLDLRSLSFGRNRLTGTIPSSIGLMRLDTLQMYENMLTGTLPSELGNLPLIQFNVGNNFLSGTIPISYLKWSIKQPLGFYTNNLTGSMPWCGQVDSPFDRIFCRLC